MEDKCLLVQAAIQVTMHQTLLRNQEILYPPLGLFASQQLFSEDPTWKSYGGMIAIYDQIQSIKWVKQSMGWY